MSINGTIRIAPVYTFSPPPPSASSHHPHSVIASQQRISLFSCSVYSGQAVCPVRLVTQSDIVLWSIKTAEAIVGNSLPISHNFLLPTPPHYPSLLKCRFMDTKRRNQYARKINLKMHIAMEIHIWIHSALFDWIYWARKKWNIC